MWLTKLLEKLKANSARKDIQRQFLLILTLLSVAYFSYGYWKHGFSSNLLWTGLGITMAMALLCYIWSKLLRPLLFLWLLLGMLLGEITSFVLLGIIYYLLFFPITFILRMSRKKNAGETPAWHSRAEDVIDYKKLS